jgi:hypothetical protein
MRRGDYGYDAPYALGTFGVLSVATGVAATTSWLRGLSHAAIPITLCFAFFLVNKASRAALFPGSAGVRVVTVTSGLGMTMSFGLAEQTFGELGVAP